MDMTAVITGPVGRILGLVVWMVVFPLMLGSINQWYTQSVPSGDVSGERFDRVVPKAADDKDVNDRWAKVTAVAEPFHAQQSGSTAQTHTLSETVAHILEEGETAGTCRVGRLTGGTSTNRDITVNAVTYYTPIGTEVSSPSATGAGHTTASHISRRADVLIAGCEYKEAGSVLSAGGLGGLIEIILQAAGLAPPIGLLVSLGSFGSNFMSRVTGGSHPVIGAILAVITLLIVAVLFNVFVPFLNGAFDAIDRNRFVMYNEGLGNLAAVIGNFLGIIVVSSMLSVAWSAIKAFRGSGGDMMSNSKQSM